MEIWKETEKKANACPGTSENCPNLPCGQKCRYVFEGKDAVSFDFSENGTSCKIVGFSKSTVSYAVLDFGTNYCNLRNLLDGANLSQGNGFTEDTNTSICTQYDQINCERF